MPAEDLQPVEIQELPPDTTPEQLVPTINSRFRRLKGDLLGFWRHGSTRTLDAGNQLISNVADPKEDTQAVNLRTLKRFAAPNKPAQENVETKPKPEAAQQYGMVFGKDGAVLDNDRSLSYPVGEGRQGEPQSVVLTANGAPTFGKLRVNFKVRKPGDVDTSDLLDLPIELDVNDKGPEFKTELLIRETLPKGTVVYMVIVEAGGAEQVTGVIVIKRTL